MKNKGKIILFYGLIFFLLLDNVYAWKNGSYIDEGIYDVVDDYGTHDWIADAVLQKLIDNTEFDWSWLSDRKWELFIGTEAPDNSAAYIYQDSEIIYGFGDTTLHHVYLFENGEINEDDAALRAKWCMDWAGIKYRNGDYNASAFYIGAMTHYIADCSMYAHIAENNVAPYYINFDQWHSTIEGYVQSRTNEYYNHGKFFHIFEMEFKPIKAYDACIMVARDTYFDLTPSDTTIRNTYWMHSNFFNGWKLSYDSRSTDTTIHQLYYNRIEESLNYAIEQCVNAILFEFEVELITEGLSQIEIILILVISLLGLGFAGFIKKKTG